SRGSVTRTSFGGTRGPLLFRAPGTHQLLHTTGRIAVSPARSARSDAAGRRTWGNGGGFGGSATCRCAGALGAPTKRTVGRPVRRHGLGPRFRSSTAPSAPAIAAWKTKPSPTTPRSAARQGAAAVACRTRSSGATAFDQATSSTFWNGADFLCDPHDVTTNPTASRTATVRRTRRIIATVLERSEGVVMRAGSVEHAAEHEEPTEHDQPDADCARHGGAVTPGLLVDHDRGQRRHPPEH